MLIDDGDGVADKAARRLAGLGYTAVHVARTAACAAWAAAGYPLFPSTNVPSKAFAEIVEIDRHTPHVTAAELDRLRREGTKMAVLDSRTVEEFNRFHVPGAVTCPGAELVHRFADLVPDPDTLVVVSCAGRTRSIIGAQSLINAGVPNQVVSLQGGTQAWRLAAGWSSSATPARRSRRSARRRSRRRGSSPTMSPGGSASGGSTARRWTPGSARAGRARPIVLDVRTPEEYAAGHLPGSVSAEGGQLVQAIDRWVGTRGARLVLVDDTGTRAIMTAQWLMQMGWDAVVLDRPVRRAESRDRQPAEPAAEPLPDVPVIGAAEAGALAQRGRRRRGRDHAERRIPRGASRGRGLGDPAASRPPAGQRAARPPHRRVRRRSGDRGAGRRRSRGDRRRGRWRWCRAASTAGAPPDIRSRPRPDDPPDSDRIDYIFWNHDRHAGNQEAMRAYLRWETELPGEVARDGLAGFRLAAV